MMPSHAVMLCCKCGGQQGPLHTLQTISLCVVCTVGENLHGKLNTRGACLWSNVEQLSGYMGAVRKQTLSYADSILSPAGIEAAPPSTPAQHLP